MVGDDVEGCMMMWQHKMVMLTVVVNVVVNAMRRYDTEMSIFCVFCV